MDILWQGHCISRLVMDLAPALARCRTLEEHAAALYRTWAARARSEPSLCALWTSLARDEEEHAQSIRALERGLRILPDRGTRIENWDEPLARIEELLDMATRLGPRSSTDSLLAMALELEMSELEGMRLTLLHLRGHRTPGCATDEHAIRLAEETMRRSRDPHVNLLATLVLARARVREYDAAAAG